MRILALDVASSGKTGYAYIDVVEFSTDGQTWKHKSEWSYGSLRFDPIHFRDLADLLFCAKQGNVVTHAIIEDGYVGINPRGSMVLAEARGAAKLLCADNGLALLKPVMPSMWQAAMLTPRGGRIPPGDTKRLSMLVASEIVGHDVTDEHAADAICIHEWAMKTYGMKEKGNR